MRRTALWIVLVVALSGSIRVHADERANFFEARIRPLLLKHCVSCHGAKKQEGGLRLDSPAGWRKGGDRGVAIQPGRPAQSLLVKAVSYRDSSLKMPPSRRLQPDEIAALRKWIRDGAFDPRRNDRPQSQKLSLAQAKAFWSFRPIKKFTSAGGWRGQSPIDAFISARLEKVGLKPLARADKRTLIRRATFDLTGLPPTPHEIRSYLRDTSDNAFAKVIDRLLASHAYGERWGRHWLDVARYADTAGDGSDYPVREAVKYRDWVVRAINQDMPYDRFVREQVAGDLLARRGPIDKYADRVIATGFLAIGKRYGYNPSADFQHLDFADVIDSIGRSILGLSIGCARCHDHKYDPISAADYYALFGIMRSTKWSFPGGEEYKRPAHLVPLVPKKERLRLNQQRVRQIAQIDKRIERLKSERQALSPNWRAGGDDLGFEHQPVGKPLVQPWVCAGPIEVRRDAQSPFTHIHPPGTRGVHIGSGKPTDGIRYVFKPGLRKTSGQTMHFSVDFRTRADARQKGAYRFYLGQGVVQSLAVECSVTASEFAIRNGSKWEVVRKVTKGKWYHLQLTLDPNTGTYSGMVGAPGDFTRIANKKLAPGWNGIADVFICDAFGHVRGPACGRDIDNIGLQSKPFGAIGTQVLASRNSKSTKATKARLQVLEKQLASLQAERKQGAMQPAYPVAYAVSEDKPRDVRIQLRGEPTRLGKPVNRRFLTVLGGDKLATPKESSGRLELATWLTRRSNPLTARVFVNRVWGWHFGRALVTTRSDFGSRGAQPSHPFLLDWLAAEFMDQGWSIKQLHRTIMLSQVYQRSSGDSINHLRLDPENRWLWRFSRRSLDAESIRDSMMILAGTLDRTIPGPHPFPPVKKWSFSIHHPFHAVYPSRHRSIYLMVQRNRRHPYLALFDAADPNLSVASRNPTTTPTQALFLMNSPFVHRQAQAFGKRLATLPGSDQARLQLAFEMTHGRPASAPNLTRTLAFLNAYRDRLRNSGRVSTSDVEWISWSASARVLMTSNAFLYVD